MAKTMLFPGCDCLMNVKSVQSTHSIKHAEKINLSFKGRLLKIAILHFEDVKRPVTGYGTYLLNLSCSLMARGHQVEILNLFAASSRVSLWGDRLKRTVYSFYCLGRAGKLGRYDIVLFAEPLYPQNLLLLKCLQLRLRACIVLWLRMPRFTSGFYYALISRQFPSFITGEIARPFAEKIAAEVYLLSPGLDVERMGLQNTPKKWDFLYIGHLFPEKGVLLLLQAMKVLKERQVNLSLKIVHIPCGEERFYSKYIRDNGLDNVDMETAVIDDRLSIYNSARAYVYPGTSYTRVVETPLTIIEASACGLPVVTTSLYRHIHLPNIVLADTTPESMAEAMLHTLESWSGWKRDRTISAVRHEYSLESLGEKAEKFFNKVLAGKSRIVR